jgi:hypothetical protein
VKVRITPRTIPGGDAKRVRVLTQATVPGRVLASLSIQKEAIGSRGIIRDQGPPFVIKKTARGPVRVEELGEQREGFLPVVGEGDSHVRRFEKSRPDRRVVAVTGCGNLLCNPGVEARTMGMRAGIRGTTRAGLVVQPNGRGRLVEGSRVEAALRTDLGTIAKSPDRFVITGPLLVAHGKVAIDAREFADPRHLVLPPYVEVAPGRRIDFGLDALVHDPEAALALAAGGPLDDELVTFLPRSKRVDSRFRMVRVPPEKLRAALLLKGYREVDRVTARGTFSIRRNRATIAYLPGIYPHHALAVDGDGVVTSVLVTGRSNREGTTVLDLAEALVKAGAVHAILLDNGGDVGLLRRRSAKGRLAFEARPAEADRARAWPTRACLIWHVARRKRRGGKAPPNGVS